MLLIMKMMMMTQICQMKMMMMIQIHQMKLIIIITKAIMIIIIQRNPLKKSQKFCTKPKQIISF